MGSGKCRRPLDAIRRYSRSTGALCAVAWFYRVLRNATIDHYRHRASTERAHEGWGKEVVTEVPAGELQQEICQCVSALVETLKPEYGDALRLVDVDEASL